MADGTAEEAAGVRPATATDPTLEDVLKAAGFEVTEAGRRRWRAQLAAPVPAAALAEARHVRDRAQGHAA